MAQKKTVKVEFEVHGVDEFNEDGTARQKILEELSQEIRVPVTFNRGEIKENHAQLVEVLVEGKKIGEISDDDYIRYNTSIGSARDAFLWIYEEQDEDGNSHYTAYAVIVVPYAVSMEARENLYKRKKKALIVCLVVFAAATVWSFIQKDWFSAGIGVLITLGFGYWTFVRRPEQDDEVLYFFKTGHKKN